VDLRLGAEPASLAETETVDPDVVKVGVPTKCGLPAIAGAANPNTAAAAMTAGAMNLRSLID